MKFNKVLEEIKSIKIQGAENIARSAVDALLSVVHDSKTHQASVLYHDLQEARKKLLLTRPTEPCMRNALNYALHNLFQKDMPDLIAQLEKNVYFVRNYFDEADIKIAGIGSNLISNSTTVFTHCHSSTVMRILKYAKKQDKDFEVHNTETRPLFQGRVTSLELAKMNVKVKHYIDSAMRLALKKADICLLGADAIQSSGDVINKIGSELVAETAEKYNVPVYICTPSWKIDPKTIYTVSGPIENRNRAEVWKDAPKKIEVINPAFERIDPDLIKSVISEIGSYSPDVFITETKRKFPWLFR